mgnify:CR=1 FL=1
MFQINCLNPISKIGLANFTTDYRINDNVNEADAILVRSAAMHDMDLPNGLFREIPRGQAHLNQV